MASFSFDSVLFSLTSLYPYFTSVSRNLTLTKLRWTLVADSRWDSAACRWIYKNRRIPYYIASSIQYSDFLSSNVNSRESLSEFGQILREFIDFILKQMKVDRRTVSFSCEHLKYGFLNEVLKTGRTRISIFCINFKWFRSRSLWSPKSHQFYIGSLYAATFNATSVYAFIDRSMWTKKDFLMLPINLNISLGGIKYLVA